MSNKKMTAVEWLARHLYDKIQDNEELFTNSLIQAKEMEKDQIIEAHAVGRIKEVSQINTDGYEYYKETYEL